MALVTGNQAASATPATDLYNTLVTSLNANNWEEETTRTYTDLIMGSQNGGTWKVWVSASTTNGAGTPVAGSAANISSGIYTGCILIIEIDNTNARLRFRTCEKFDSSLASIASFNATTTVATEIFTKTTHGLAVGDSVYFRNIVNTTGISTATQYYVNTVPTANTFTIVTTIALIGGAALNLTGTDGTVDVDPARSNVKWGVYGGSGTVQNPTANGAMYDSFLSAQQAAATNQRVAWVEVACSASGFTYWLGVNANKVIVANNSSGNQNVCIAGQISTNYGGDLSTTVGQGAVFLYGAPLSSTTTCGSWTFSSATSGDTCSLRTSREPVLSTASFSGPWMFDISGPVRGAGQGTALTPPQNPYGGAGVVHRYYSAAFLAFPLWLHGYDTYASTNSGRSNFAQLTEFIVFIRPDWHNQTNPIVRGYAPNIGEQVTGGGVTYTSLGITHSPFVSTSAATSGVCILVDGSQFS